MSDSATLSNDHRSFAYPCETPPGCRDGQDIPFGLTKRELFAAMALQGLLAGPDYDPTGPIHEAAVRHADALLTALQRSTEP